MDELKQILENIEIDKPIKKEIKIKIEKILKELNYENKDVTKILNKKTITKNEKIQLKELLLKIIYQDDNNLSISQIEKELDNEIHEYIKYSKKNPMYGISQNEMTKKWSVRSVDLNINLRYDDLQLATEFMINKINESRTSKFIEDIKAVNYIEYKNKKIIIYDSIITPLFDILHIFKLIDINSNYCYEKYNKFKNFITHHTFKKNEHDGYVIKEFINEITMYEIILSSKSDFSKKFKSDISNILVKLRNIDQFIIKDDTNITQSNIPNYNKNNICDYNIAKYLDGEIKSNISQTYDNSYYCELVKDLVIRGSKIILEKYVHHNLMYFFIVTMKNPNNKILCKIGFTSNYPKRLSELINKFACNFYLLSLKTVRCEQDEKAFHNLIKKTRPDLVYKLTLNNKEIEEIYIFDEILLEEFNSITDYVKIPEINNISENYLQQSIKNQYSFFIRDLNIIHSNNFYEALININNFSEYHKETIIHYLNSNNSLISTDLMLRDKEKNRDYELKKIKETIELEKIILEKEKIILEQKKYSKQKSNTRNRDNKMCLCM